jgi:hypothetical protein
MVTAITCTPNTAAVGDTVSVHGTGFSATSAVTVFTYQGVTPTHQTITLQTTAGGAFTGTFVVPAQGATVTPTIIITDAGGGTITTAAAFTVKQAITTIPVFGPVGRQIAVTGSGYVTADNIATFTFTGVTPTINTCVGAVVGATGAWTGTFTIPSTATDGAHTIVATSTGALTASASINVTSDFTTVTKVTGKAVVDPVSGQTLWVEYFPNPIVTTTPTTTGSTTTYDCSAAAANTVTHNSATGTGNVFDGNQPIAAKMVWAGNTD